MMDFASSSSTTASSSSSSGYVARENYMFQLGVLFLSLQVYSMLVEYV